MRTAYSVMFVGRTLKYSLLFFTAFARRPQLPTNLALMNNCFNVRWLISLYFLVIVNKFLFGCQYLFITMHELPETRSV